MDHYFDNPLPLKLYPVRPSTQPQPTAAPIIRHSNQGSNATLTWPWFLISTDNDALPILSYGAAVRPGLSMCAAAEDCSRECALPDGPQGMNEPLAT